MEKNQTLGEVISIQVVWQIIGQKEWQIQMLSQQVRQLQQKLTEALAELSIIKEQLKKD